MSEPVALLNAWLDRQLDASARAWLDERRARLAAPHADRDLYMAVGLVPRALGKDDLRLDAGDLAAAHAARPGWDPTGLSVDQAARLALVLTASHRGEAFFAAFHELWRTADVGEQVTFYKGLPLYPAPERFLWRATDGCRTSSSTRSRGTRCALRRCSRARRSTPSSASTRATTPRSRA